MKIVCSFCNSVIVPGKTAGDPVSHGVCPTCFSKIRSDFGFNVRDYLDMLEAPVFLVDSDANVLAANTLAAGAVQKPQELVHGHICGNVLDCINAFLPGGCGKTPDCPDCEVRNAVNETYRTGMKIDNRPADVRRKVCAREETGQLLVSTRKDGDIVLLRLEFVDTPSSPV
jgi:hypothetical protein